MKRLTDARRLAAELRPRLNQLTLLLRRQSAGGLTASQVSVLHALKDGRPWRISDLADREGVTQPTMSIVIKRMQMQGWVVRASDELDRRVVNVTITATGADRVERVGAARVALLAQLLAGLSDADRAAIAAALPAFDRLAEVATQDHPTAHRDRKALAHAHR